jgi:hypothetical protein
MHSLNQNSDNAEHFSVPIIINHLIPSSPETPDSLYKFGRASQKGNRPNRAAEKCSL